MMKGLGIPYDTMDTVNALATFNVLNEEGRNVVGAFLPLDPVDVQQIYTPLGKPEAKVEGPPWAAAEGRQPNDSRVKQ